MISFSHQYLCPQLLLMCQAVGLNPTYPVQYIPSLGPNPNKPANKPATFNPSVLPIPNRVSHLLTIVYAS